MRAAPATSITPRSGGVYCLFTALGALGLLLLVLGSTRIPDPQHVWRAAVEVVLPSQSQAATPSASSSGSQSATPSASQSATPSASASFSQTPSDTGTRSPSRTLSASVSHTATGSLSLSSSRTSSITPSPSASSRDSNTLPPFVYVHVGPYAEFFPDFMADSVSQVAKWNPDAVIHIVIPQIFMNRTSMVDAAAMHGASVSLWAIEDLPKSADHIMFEHGSTQDRGFRGGFWRVTTERLFILDDFLRFHGIDEAVHMENDNLIYFSLRDKISAFRKHYPGLTMTPHACAAFVYVGHRDMLQRLVATMTNATTDEMLMVRAFNLRHGNDAIGPLPIVAPGDVGQLSGYTRNYDAFGGLFDGAPHGQYIGGPDPRNNHGGPGFVNQQAPYSTRDFDYEWTVDPKSGLRLMHMRKKLLKGGSGEWRPLLHLHIHCKNLTQFAS